MTAPNLPDWRRKLRPASFRGVPFYVQSAQTTIGRRVVVHEYPQKDDGYPEDLGLKDDAFTIEALVIGPDYMAARDALIEALKKRGPGTLVHPYYGRRTVTLLPPARISERPSDGGCARFSLEFIEAGEDVEPSARKDTQEAVERAADDAGDAAAADFEDGFSINGVADFVSQQAQALGAKAVKALSEAQRKFAPIEKAVSDVAFATARISNSLGTLLRKPAAFAQSVLALVGQLKEAAKTPQYAMRSYRSLFDYGNDLPAVARTTPSRRREADNQVAMSVLIRRTGLIEAARIASRTTFDSYDAAVAVRDELAVRLDDAAAGMQADGSIIVVSEPVYKTLTDLRVALVRDLTARAIDAPRVTTTILPSTMPALVAAYMIWGDATRADELVTRNAYIPHPGFVPGGRPLEIVVD